MVSAEASLQIQIRQLEQLLKNPNNNTCADCPGKTPRWASITFGTFVCLRCSGQHRSMGVHITKIKSVNLDKWPAGKVEAFQAMSNNLVNSYWEANLPKNFQKPSQQANTSEVTRFLKEKYVDKKWVDTDMKYDPFYLYENKRSRFDKFVKRALNRAGVSVDSEEESQPAAKKQKKPKLGQALSAQPAPARTVQQPQPQPQVDLISMAPVQPQPAAQQDNLFSDFVSATPQQTAPAQLQDDGFSDFQGTQAAAPDNQNKLDQLNNILSMMGQQNHVPTTAKYAAFETMPDFNRQSQQQARPPQVGQMPQMPQQPAQQTASMQMQQMQQMLNQQQQQPMGQPASAAGFQPQFFNSAMQQQQSNQQQSSFNQFGNFGGAPSQPAQPQWQATFSGGAQPTQPTQPTQPQGFQNNGFGAQQTNNMFANMQPPQFNNAGAGMQQPQQPMNNAGFGGFQSAPQMNTGSAPGGGAGSYYGGLVNLAPPSGQAGTGAQQQVNPQQKQTQQASFNNLVNW